MSRVKNKPHSIKKPVGLTGGIGSGKSSVAQYCKEQFGIKYIDADLVCRDLLAPRAPGWEAFRKNFGDKFLAQDQTIDRQKLRTAIFQDLDLRQRLNAIVHPLARTEIKNMLAGSDPDQCLVEVPLLFEAGWEEDFSSIIVVYATDESCLERLTQRDQISRDAAIRAIAAQLPINEKVRRADHIIDNSKSWEETCRQLEQLGKILWQAK